MNVTQLYAARCYADGASMVMAARYGTEVLVAVSVHTMWGHVSHTNHRLTSLSHQRTINLPRRRTP